MLLFETWIFPTLTNQSFFEITLNSKTIDPDMYTKTTATLLYNVFIDTAGETSGGLGPHREVGDAAFKHCSTTYI